MSFRIYFTVAGVFLGVAFSFSAHAQVQQGQNEKEIANMEAIEQALHCRVQRYPYGFDEATGLKMLFVLTNESPYKVRNGIDYVILTNKENEVVYVVLGVIRHDNDVDDVEPWYGLYVVGEEIEGEIGISHLDYYPIIELIYQRGKPEFLDLTDIRFMKVQDPDCIPFTPVREANRKKCRRFFGTPYRQKNNNHCAYQQMSADKPSSFCVSLKLKDI